MFWCLPLTAPWPVFILRHLCCPGKHRVSAWLACLVLLFSTPAFAEGPLAPVNKLSPSQTYESLVSGVRLLEDLYGAYSADKSFVTLAELRYHFKRLRGLLDLSAVPPANRVKTGNAAITYLADIISRLPPVDPDSIPGASGNDAPLPARWTLPGTDIQIARIDSGPHEGEYLFTAESVDNLYEYFSRIRHLDPVLERRYPSLRIEHVNATGPFIPAGLTQRIPDALKVPYLSTPLWKIIAICIVTVFVSLLAYGWARHVRNKVSRGSVVRKLGWRFTVPILFLCLYFLTVWFVIDHLNPSGLFAAGEGLISTAVLYVLSAWAAWIGTFLLVETLISSPRVAGNSFDAHLLRLTARIVAVCSTGGILMYGANELGIPALGLAAGVGVGGFALALASQSTVENLFGGLSLFADRPFRIGDVIGFGNERGTVEMVGTRSSRIRALDGTLVTVPNSDLAKMKIMNLTRRTKCLFSHTVALSVETPPDRLEELLLALRTLVAADDMVEKTRGWPRIRCVGIEVGRINVELRAYVLTDDYTQFLGIQERLLLQVLQCIEAMEIRLAPPVVALQPSA